LLPGLDGTGKLFKPILAEIPPEIRPLVISYPSDKALDLAELAAHAVKQLPDGKSVLIAESFSGLVALALLPDAASRFHGVIFVGAFAEPPRPMVLRFAPVLSGSSALVRAIPAFLLRQLCLGPDASAESIRQLRETIASVSPAVIAQRLAIVGRRQSFKRLPRDLRCCYIRARQDRMVPAPCADWFRTQFKALQLREIDGPHFLMQARPRETAKLLTEEVRRISGAM
jgi:pimeloyl-ACP methyl ester carboxylesterase